MSRHHQRRGRLPGTIIAPSRVVPPPLSERFLDVPRPSRRRCRSAADAGAPSRPGNGRPRRLRPACGRPRRECVARATAGDGHQARQLRYPLHALRHPLDHARHRRRAPLDLRGVPQGEPQAAGRVRSPHAPQAGAHYTRRRVGECRGHPSRQNRSPHLPLGALRLGESTRQCAQ